MATDYLLAVVAFGAAAWLWTAGAGLPGRWWALAFAFTGVAAILGGTSHGYAPILSRSSHRLLWRLTYVSVSAANLCILYGAALAALRVPWRRLAATGLLVRLVVVASALIAKGELRFVLYDYALTLVFLLALAVWLLARGEGGGWVAAGVLVSVVGAAVQHGRFGQGHAFNHNDWFHVIQALGLVLYARGGRPLAVRDQA